MQAPPQEKSSSPILKIACFGCIALAILTVTCCGGSTWMAMSMVKNSPPYQDGVAMAASNPDVKKALGEPVVGDWWVGGSVQDQGATGFAQVVAPVSGPKGKGLLEVNANKAGGKWTINSAAITIFETGERIDLMPDDDASDDKKTTAEGEKTEAEKTSSSEDVSAPDTDK
jgi:cytochrome oxidase complex assembly protein 1